MARVEVPMKRRRIRLPLQRPAGSVFLLAVVAIGCPVLSLVILALAPRRWSPSMIQRQVAAWVGGNHEFELSYRWDPLLRHLLRAAVAVVAAEAGSSRCTQVSTSRPSRTRSSRERGGRLRGASTISPAGGEEPLPLAGPQLRPQGMEAYLTVLLELSGPSAASSRSTSNTAEMGRGSSAWARPAGVLRQAPVRPDPHEAALLAAVLPNRGRSGPSAPPPTCAARRMDPGTDGPARRTRLPQRDVAGAQSG